MVAHILVNIFVCIYSYIFLVALLETGKGADVIDFSNTSLNLVN